jgi:hypothetical protein
VPTPKEVPSTSKAEFHYPAPVSDNHYSDSWCKRLFKCCGDGNEFFTLTLAGCQPEHAIVRVRHKEVEKKMTLFYGSGGMQNFQCSRFIPCKSKCVIKGFGLSHYRLPAYIHHQTAPSGYYL